MEDAGVWEEGRYLAPEPSTSKVQEDGAEDTEEETDDERPNAVFPYEEVVRGKRRKELNAEDCGECREVRMQIYRCTIVRA